MRVCVQIYVIGALRKCIDFYRLELPTKVTLKFSENPIFMTRSGFIVTFFKIKES